MQLSPTKIKFCKALHQYNPAASVYARHHINMDQPSVDFSPLKSQGRLTKKSPSRPYQFCLPPKNCILRSFVDCRRMNVVIQQESNPVLRMNEFIDPLEKYTVFFASGANRAYEEVEIDDDGKVRTTITSPATYVVSHKCCLDTIAHQAHLNEQ